MFDGKTVTAVFVSLAIIAVLTSGQQISAPNIDGGFNLESLLPSGQNTNFDDRPEPNNTVEAQFSADLSNETLQVQNTNVTSQGLDSVKSIGLDSQQPITLREFTGEILLQGSNVTLIGNAEGYSTSGVNVEQNFQVNSTHTSSELAIQTVKFQHTFNQTEGSLTSSTNEGSTADTVSFNSFTGDITFNLESQNVGINGKVDRLDSGSFIIN